MPKHHKKNKAALKSKVFKHSAFLERNHGALVSPIVKKSTVRKKSNVPDIALPLTRVGLWYYNLKSDAIQWSIGAFKFFGLSRQSDLKSTFLDLTSIVLEEDRLKFITLFKLALQNKHEFHVEVRISIPGGSFQWLEFSANPLFLKNGAVSKFVGTVQDITIKKLTEYELADWKTRNELVSESAGLLIYDYDVLSGDIIWSGNTKQVVGFKPLEMARIEQWENLIHPDDREEAFRLLELAKTSLKAYDVYYRFQHKNPGYCYMHDRGLFVSNKEGEAVRMLGIMSDVSERVAAVKTIEQSEKSYRQLFNSVGEAIYIQNPDGTFADVNDTACVMYGYGKEEFIGRTPEFLSAPGKNDFQKLEAQIQEALQGRAQSFVWWGKKKSGEIFLKEVRLTKGTYFGAMVVIATAWDITQKVAAEKSLLESEKRFRRMIEDLNVGVVLQGPKEEVQIANRAALCLLNISEKELFEKTLTHPSWQFITERNQVLMANHLPWDVAARTKKAVRGEVVGLITGDASINPVWLLVNAEPTLLDHEELLHVIVTFTDITERRRIEEDLKESELRFRTLQEASFGGIGLHNKGTIIDCNQGLCNITGYSYEELIGSNGLDLIAPEYRELVMQRIVSKNESPYDVEGVRKDGSRYSLEIHGKNIPYQEGQIRVTEFRDITERKAAEAKIVEQNAKLLAITESLKQKNEQLQEFTQIVSHNLRSPVGNILSLLNFIENADSEDERTEYIGLLKEAGATTLSTLQELNEVLQIKQNKNIERHHLEFGQVFSNVRTMLNARIAEANAVIECDFNEAPTIEYPNIYLESILLNLLSNALKYSDPDRRPLIKVKTTCSKDEAVTLTISDNGKGINMQRYGHQIFKLRKTFHKHPESRGIGLFMIKSQIEAMGGNISVTSAENEGSTFRINFNKLQEDE